MILKANLETDHALVVTVVIQLGGAGEALPNWQWSDHPEFLASQHTSCPCCPSPFLAVKGVLVDAGAPGAPSGALFAA